MDIIKRLEKLERNEPIRNYIGASSIGHPCFRKIWYEFHKPELRDSPTARTLRIFEIGHAIEAVMIDLLRRAGIEVLVTDQIFTDKELPYLQGHVDGILPHEDMVLELKTCKDSSFKLFKKKGVKEWFPAYYYQAQCYMAFTGLNKALVLAINKDNAELHSEVVKYDEKVFNYIKLKAKSIHEGQSEPPRLSNNPAWFQCVLCDFHKYCHKL